MAHSFIEVNTLKLLNKMLSALVKKGSLTLVDAEGVRHSHGDGTEPHVAVKLHDPGLYAKIFLNPDLIAGEAYMDESLTFEEGSVRDLLITFHKNSRTFKKGPLRRILQKGVMNFRRFQQHNPISRSQQNVAHHYDLSNDFYRLFLDDKMNYSCAYFSEEGETLESAQIGKLRHIAAKLDLSPGMRVLDIGCGWGGMAIYLAKNFDVEVVGVTLSEEQFNLAKERAREAGVSDKVEFRLCDYRHVNETYDRFVSIGMFEHVGAPQFRQFFEKINTLLTPDGSGLLHSIGTMNGPGVTGPWIRKYIFPGGYSPALSETFAAIEEAGLWATDTEILRMHYAETLGEWERRFQAKRPEAAAMFDEKFCRMWEFYLSTAEFAFRYGGHMNFQIQLAKTPNAVPITRNYMRKNEKLLKQKDE